MKCFYHEDREAVATCQRCGKSLCKKCASRFEIVYCEDCAIFLKTKAENEKEKNRQEALIDTKGEIMKALTKGTIAFVIAFVFLKMLMVDFTLLDILELSGLFFFFPFGWAILSYIPWFYSYDGTTTLFLIIITVVIKFIGAVIIGIPCFIFQIVLLLVRYSKLKKNG